MNYEYLKKLIADSQYSIVEICETIGLKRGTFYFQLKNDSLSVSSLLKIAELLRLTNDQVLVILNRN